MLVECAGCLKGDAVMCTESRVKPQGLHGSDYVDGAAGDQCQIF